MMTAAYAHFRGEAWAVTQPHLGTSAESLRKKGRIIYKLCNELQSAQDHLEGVRAHAWIPYITAFDPHSGHFRVVRVCNVRAGRMAVRTLFVNAYMTWSRSQMDRDNAIG